MSTPNRPPTNLVGDWYKTAKHFDEMQSKNVNLPRWMRIVHFHRSRMKPGGYCYTSRQELAELLGVDASNVARYVKQAVDYGYLANGSTAKTLKAPFDVEFNRGGR